MNFDRERTSSFEEAESAPLRRHLRRRGPLTSSALARTEVLRALLDDGDAGMARGRESLGLINLVRVNDRDLNAAGSLPPSELGELDAIHLATALQLGDDVREVITYDERMTRAAESLLRPAAPS